METTVARIAGIERLTQPELLTLASAADQIGTHVDNLAAVIGFETGKSWLTSQLNRAGSGAVGLIQFMPETACGLLGWKATPENKKLATKKFAEMSFTEQMLYVVKYFKQKGKKLDTLEALYCAVFWPVAIDKDNDYVIGTRGGAVYRQNAGFDTMGNKDGKITRGEICQAVRNVLTAAEGKPRVQILPKVQPIGPAEPARPPVPEYEVYIPPTITEPTPVKLSWLQNLLARIVKLFK